MHNDRTGWRRAALWRTGNSRHAPAAAAASASASGDETLKAFMRLQNGSDIRGVAIEGGPGIQSETARCRKHPQHALQNNMAC